MKKILTACTVLLLLLSQVSPVLASDRGRDGRKLLAGKTQQSEFAVPLPASLRAKAPRTHANMLASDEAIYMENFDSGAPGWTFEDLWSESAWHITTVGAFSGSSYWCAEQALGGYDDMWVQSLTSPAITLTAGTNTLTFMHNLSVEPLSGGYPAGYDAWDAVTVRISTDGETFDPISPSGGPAYNANSAYGFHFYYGTGVPAWGGSTGGWVSSTFDLTPYAGQTVFIRFELGSDEVFSHGDDPSLFGWLIDKIQVTAGGSVIYSDDAGDTSPARFTGSGPGGPSQWHITNVAAVSAPNSAGCFDPASGNYVSNSKTGLVSPAIPIATLPTNTRQLIPDLQLRGVLDPAADADGNSDVFIVETRSYDNGAWSYWVSPAPGAPNGVFIGGLPPAFAGFNASYTNDLDVSALIGAADSLQFRFILISAPDESVVAPANIFVDNFAITAVTTLANDVTLIDLDVPFPNIIAFDAQSAQARVQNIGLNNQPTVLTRYRVNDGPVTLPIPPVPVSVAPNAQAPVNFNWRLPAGSVPGDFKLTALTTLGQDENRTNDTLSVEPVTVYPEGLAELGYDDRFNQDQFITITTCLVSFTVLSDLRGLTDTYDLNTVKIDLFNTSSEADDQLRIVIATASNDTTIQDVLFEGIESVPAGDFSSHFFHLGATGLTAERIIVLVDFSVSNGTAALIMDGRTRFTGHNFARSGGRWVASSFGRQIRAWVSWLGAPDIASVRDVPNDNGRQAHVVWFPSPNEALGQISNYVLWRAVKGSGANEAVVERRVQVPTMQALYDYGIQKGKTGDRVSIAGSNSTWDFITAVPAHPGFTAYGYVAPTLADSNATGRNYTTFMVTAYDFSGQFVDSEVDSGYSVDNIAPAVPPGLTAVSVPSGPSIAVKLDWKAVEDEDLAYYAIYKNDAATPLARTTDLTFTDPNVTVGTPVKYNVTAFDINGNQSAAASVTHTPTGVADRPGKGIPTAYALDNNYPNPFNPQTTIEFALPQNGHVKLVILNAMGQEIETLVDRNLEAGYHQTVWNANKHTSGVYFYRLTANNFSQLKKMVLAK